MSYSAAAIRTAIKNVLEGASGQVRTLAAEQMLSGVFEGQTDQARKAKTLHGAEHRFDVRIGALRQHESSPVSAIGSYRLARADIFIDVTTKTATQVQLDARDTVLANVLSDVEQAAQALSYPTNVEQTAALAATGIVSGMLTGPGGEGVPVCEEPQQDWDKQEIKTRISAGAILRIRQNTIVDSEPLEIFGDDVRAWYRSDAVYDSAASVTHWTDTSGNGLTLTPPGDPSNTLAVDPTSSISGLQSLLSLGAGFFDSYRVEGAGAFLESGDAPNVLVVGRFTQVDTGVISRIVDALDGSGNVVFRCIKNAADNIAYQVDATTVATSTAADTSAHLFEFLNDGNSTRVRVDDAAATVGAAAPLSAAAAELGVPSTSSSNCAAFEYWEIVLLNSYPIASQREAYRQYVVDRYGLSITP